ncbi:MAG: yeats family-domain-containing protein [Linnemannia gamsii]|nr:MAG: yeats family-domain-containing protein [Linnemannia gamsii]
MPQKGITKEIKVITDQHIVKGQKQNGFPMRKWKMSLMGVNANGEEESLPYVDHVEYILHHTFEQPLRKVTKFPFVLQEKGWGEFDMKVMIHFVDNAEQPVMLDHDLNFQMNHYEVAHTLTFKSDIKPSFLKLLNRPVETISDRDSQMSSNDSGIDGKAHKRRKDAILKEKSKRVKADRSSDEDSQGDSSAASGDEWDNEINVHILAEKFQRLQASDLIEVIKMVKAKQTSEMYVREDGEAGEYQIDLRTLGDDLLNQLWQFCTKRLDG